MSDKLREALTQRITEYLGNGGLFNPESMEHNKVRDLLIDCRAALTEAKGQEEDWMQREIADGVAPGTYAPEPPAEAPAVTPSGMQPDGTWICPTCKDPKCGAPDLPVSSQHDTEDGNVGHVSVGTSSSGAAREVTNVHANEAPRKDGNGSTASLPPDKHAKLANASFPESISLPVTGAASDLVERATKFLASCYPDEPDCFSYDCDGVWAERLASFAEQIRTAEKERCVNEMEVAIAKRFNEREPHLYAWYEPQSVVGEVAAAIRQEKREK